MIEHRTAWATILMLFTMAGCAQFPAVNSMFKQSFASMKPDSGDYADGTDDIDTGWERKVGLEARGDRPVDVENDPFRVFMSPKARSIEQNLGFD